MQIPDGRDMMFINEENGRMGGEERRSMNIKKINQMFLVTVLISLLAGFLPLNRMFPDEGARLLFSEVLLAAPGAIWIFAAKRSYVKTVRLKKIHGSTVLLLFLFFIAIMPLMSMINAISMLFVDNVTGNTLAQVVSGHSFPVSLVLIALLPCVFEESVYRGLFYNEYRKAAPIGGIVLSAFLFGIMHANWNQFSYAFVMGVVFSLLIEATDSILSSMLVHFFINGWSATLLFLVDRFSEYFSEEIAQAFDTAQDMTPQTFGDVLRTFLPMVLVGTAAAVVIYRQIAVKEGRLAAVREIFARGARGGEAGARVHGKRVSLFSVPLVVAIVFLVLLMVVNELL